MGHYNGFYGNVDCDRYTLQPGWYRFLGAAGTEMPTSCVGKNRCGWLSGQHPSVADGIVYVKVCFHWHSSCCQWSAYIRVRNCSGFYVYELVPVRYCSSRFCGNGGGKKDRHYRLVEKHTERRTDRKPISRRIDCRQTVVRDKWPVTRQTDELNRDKHVDEQHTHSNRQ